MANIQVSERWVDDATAELKELHAVEKAAHELLDTLDVVWRKDGGVPILAGPLVERLNRALDGVLTGRRRRRDGDRKLFPVGTPIHVGCGGKIIASVCDLCGEEVPS